MQKPLAWRVSETDSNKLLYDFRGITNSKPLFNKVQPGFVFEPISLPEYQQKFARVMQGLRLGESFLTNLTIKSRLQASLDLRSLFHQVRAPYRLWLANEFLVFSPETFVSMRNGHIYSNPMKGTIDAGVPDAEKVILNNAKEMAEHVTIVDLIRNDLSRFATDVKVDRFRYVDRINTNRKALLQVSSEISGRLPSDYRSRLGDILLGLLPAGSVSGAPKPKTLSIIRDAEGEERGYYTGVAGYFDGADLDSMVMIRFIEQRGCEFSYRSGGGITAQSHLEQEYAEALDKIYVPVD